MLCYNVEIIASISGVLNGIFAKKERFDGGELFGITAVGETGQCMKTAYCTCLCYKL